MSAFKSGVKMIDRTRVCVLLVLIFVCSIDRSNSVGMAAETKTDQLLRRHPSSLTPQQLESAVTIEFNFNHIDKKNHTALEVARREVLRKILEYLKIGKSTTASPAALNATIVAAAANTATTTVSPTTISLTAITLTTPTTTISSTLTTPTTTALATTQTAFVFETATETPTTAGVPDPSRKRRRRDIGGTTETYTEEDFPFVLNDIEFDENGNLIITIFFNETGPDDPDLLYNAINDLNKLGELEAVAKAPVVNFYKGLPRVKAAMVDFRVWLPILLTIILLLIIFIFAYFCWLATNKKVKDDDRKKLKQPLDSNPSPSNGHAPPRILDDNHGYLVPMGEFSSEWN